MRVSNFTALYSDLDVEYQQEYCGPFEDLSYKDIDGQIIAGLKDGLISGFGRSMVCIGGDKFQKQQIERLWEIAQDIEYMDFLVDGNLSPISKFLLQHGHKVIPYYTQIIDLRSDLPWRYHGLRRCYRQLVNRNAKWPDVVIGGSAMLRNFKNLHFEVIGRKTRSDLTWDIQRKMVCNDQAFVSGSGQAGCMFYHNDLWAYYAVSVAMPGINMHHLIWDAIKHLKDKGIRFLEMGEQVFSGNEKLMNISKFKRGFGGETKTRLILRKD